MDYDELEPEIAKLIYEVVEPKDEGIRVKITAQSDDGDLGGVPWTETITMTCPECRCSIYFSPPHVIVFVATLPSFLIELKMCVFPI